MPGTLEERVAYIEGRVEEHSKAWEDLKDMIINLDHKVDTKIDSLDQRFSSRMDSLDQKVDRFRDELSSKIDSLDQKFSRYFLWIIGIQVTIFLSIIVTLLRS
ncbi:MAG: hypothetical protein DRH43_05840 [Deltaproteobacteria bacterium]|nr:MAG: hypothetical protein DRH43_05840 [Deltaproteobacteria bacterium]